MRPDPSLQPRCDGLRLSGAAELIRWLRMNWRPAIVTILGVLLACPAWANAGIPMLALAWPAQWLAFVPVVLIETAVIATALNSRYREQLWPVARANLLSTLVGVPIAWLAMLAVEAGVAAIVFGLLPESVADLPGMQIVLFPLMAAWIGGSSSWEFEVAFLVLSVPFCLASVYIEYRSLKGALDDGAARILRGAIWRGNILTYCLLCLAVVIGLLWN